MIMRAVCSLGSMLNSGMKAWLDKAKSAATTARTR